MSLETSPKQADEKFKISVVSAKDQITRIQGIVARRAFCETACSPGHEGQKLAPCKIRVSETALPWPDDFAMMTSASRPMQESSKKAQLKFWFLLATLRFAVNREIPESAKWRRQKTRRKKMRSFSVAWNCRSMSSHRQSLLSLTGRYSRFVFRKCM